MAKQFGFVKAELGGAQGIPTKQRELCFGLDTLQAAGGKLANPPTCDSISSNVDRGPNRHGVAGIGSNRVERREHLHGGTKATD